MDMMESCRHGRVLNKVFYGDGIVQVCMVCGKRRVRVEGLWSGWKDPEADNLSCHFCAFRKFEKYKYICEIESRVFELRSLQNPSDVCAPYQFDSNGKLVVDRQESRERYPCPFFLSSNIFDSNNSTHTVHSTARFPDEVEDLNYSHPMTVHGEKSEYDQGLKFDKGKQPWYAMPLEILEPLEDVFRAGEKKYETFNCLKPFDDPARRFYDATMRHVEAQQINPLAKDPDTGCYHAAQIAFNALMRLYHCRKLQEEKGGKT